MKKFYFGLLTLLLTLVAAPSQAQLEELTGKVITMGSAATEIVAGQWYVMQNGGRGVYAYENSGQALMAMSTSDISFDGKYATEVYGYLVRFLPVEGQDGSYYMQSGSGRYWGELTEGSNNGTTSEAQFYYVSGKISGYDNWFSFVGNNGEMVLDCNGAGSTVAGWGTSLPTSITSNAAWQILQTTLTADEDIATATINYHYALDDQTLYTYTQVQRGLKTGYEVVFDAPKARYGVTCSDATKASETITEDKTFDVTYNYTVNAAEPMPFQTTTIVDGAYAENTKWYYLTPYTTTSNFAYSVDDDEYCYYQKWTAHPINLSYMFCFTGNPLAGYQIRNYMKNANTGIDASGYVTFSGTPADYLLQLGNNDKGFSFNEISNAASYLNAYGSQLTIYTSASYAYTDGGSAFDITEVTSEELAQAKEGVLKCEADPADGYAWEAGESIDVVQLTFDGEKGELSDDAVAIIPGMEEGKIALTDADGNVVAIPTYKVDEDSPAILDVVFSPALSTPGKYFLNVSANIVKGTATGLPNQESTLTYTIKSAAPARTVTARCWKEFTNEFRTYTGYPYQLPYVKHSDSDTEYFTCKVKLISDDEIELIDYEGCGDDTDTLDFKYDSSVEFVSKSTHNGTTINNESYWGAYNFSNLYTKTITDQGEYVVGVLPTYSNCRRSDGYGQAQFQFYSYDYESYYYLCFDWYDDDRYAWINTTGKVYNKAFTELGYDDDNYAAFTQLPYGEDGTYSVDVQVCGDTIIVKKYDGVDDAKLAIANGGVAEINGAGPDEGYTSTWVTSSVIDGLYSGWYCYMGTDEDSGLPYAPAKYDSNTDSGYVILNGYDFNVYQHRYIYIAIGNYQPEPTGITAVAGSKTNAAGSAIYNIAGQKMSKIQKGLNIINGNKVVY